MYHGPFKIAVIKPLIKKPTLDPEVLANYRPISNRPFLSKILEKLIANQLCEFLQESNIYEYMCAPKLTMVFHRALCSAQFYSHHICFH